MLDIIDRKPFIMEWIFIAVPRCVNRAAVVYLG
jgi:hypothetical protein